MTDTNTNPYEGLFLFPQTADLRESVQHLESILARGEAQIISLSKWDERRLAYEIKGNKRGIYFLVYFRARPETLMEIERSCNLSERLLRSMVLRADHLPLEVMEAADGRATLDDEIKLRESQPAPAGSSGGDDSADELGDAVEVVTTEPEAVESET